MATHNTPVTPRLDAYHFYEEEWDSYDVDIAPKEVTEHTNLGRVGGLLVSLGFTLLFLGELL